MESWLSFDEWKRTREKWLGRDDDELASIDRGSTILSNVRKHIYELEGYRCKSLEEVESVAKAMGLEIKSLEARPEMIQAGAGKYDLLVRIFSKASKERRERFA